MSKPIDFDSLVRIEHLRTITSPRFAGDPIAAAIGWAANVIEDHAERVKAESEITEVELYELAAALWTAFASYVADTDPSVLDDANEPALLRLITGGAS